MAGSQLLLRGRGTRGRGLEQTTEEPIEQAQAKAAQETGDDAEDIAQPVEKRVRAER